jgi:hypothetical protein
MLIWTPTQKIALEQFKNKNPGIEMDFNTGWSRRDLVQPCAILIEWQIENCQDVPGCTHLSCKELVSGRIVKYYPSSNSEGDYSYQDTGEIINGVIAFLPGIKDIPGDLNFLNAKYCNKSLDFDRVDEPGYLKQLAQIRKSGL